MSNQAAEANLKVDYRNNGSEITEDLRRSSIHEAAHALAVWAAGGILRRVSIVGPVKGLDELSAKNFCEFKGKNLSEFEDTINLDIKVSMAPALQEELSGQQISYGSLVDVYNLMQLITWKKFEIQEMAEDARKLLRDKAEDWKSASITFFSKHKSDIEEIIDQPLAQKAISKLAEKLLDQGRVDGYEAVSLFEEVYNGRPERALPARMHSEKFKNDNLPAAIRSTGMMVKAALSILREYTEKDALEEEMINKIELKLVETIFQINGIFSKL